MERNTHKQLLEGSKPQMVPATCLEVTLVFCFFLFVAFLVSSRSTYSMCRFENHKMTGVKEKALSPGQSQRCRQKCADYLYSPPGTRGSGREITDDFLVHLSARSELLKQTRTLILKTRTRGGHQEQFSLGKEQGGYVENYHEFRNLSS